MSGRTTFALPVAPRLLPDEFDALRTIIKSVCGITLNDTKAALVESRLSPRLRSLKITSFSEYIRLLDRGAGSDELSQLVNCITTNKTSFFREKHHFDLLARTIVPEIVARARRTGERRIRIWSAGCSTGEEPYSIAMTLLHVLSSHSGWDLRILASDIDTKVLATAEEAIYDAAKAADVPARLRARSFEELGGDRFRVKPEVRRLVTFRRINFVEATWPVRTAFDVIFCRNVIIYFDRDTQRRLYERLVRFLLPDGYLVAGHSENLYWLPDLLTPAGGTVYRHAAMKASSKGKSMHPRGKSTLPRGKSMHPRGKSMLPRSQSKHPGKSERPKPRRIAIHVGGVHASGAHESIRTLLGSCVAACLHDPVARVGGMNHFMLPEGDDDAFIPTRFGLQAMEVLINALMKLGAQRGRLVAKVFGAASVLTGLATLERVSARNAAFIETFLSDEGIPLVAKKLGGNRPMQVEFDTWTGKVRVSTMDPQDGLTIADEEKRHLDRIAHAPADPSADVTFF